MRQRAKKKTKMVISGFRGPWLPHGKPYQFASANFLDILFEDTEKERILQRGLSTGKRCGPSLGRTTSGSRSHMRGSRVSLRKGYRGFLHAIFFPDLGLRPSKNKKKSSKKNVPGQIGQLQGHPGQGSRTLNSYQFFGPDWPVARPPWPRGEELHFLAIVEGQTGPVPSK